MTAIFFFTLNWLKADHRSTKKLLIRVCSLWLLFAVCMMMPVEKLAWGKEFALHFRILIVAMSVGGALISLVSPFSVVGAVFSYVSFTMICQNSPSFLDGGDNVMSLLLFYNILMVLGSQKNSDRFLGGFLHILGNLALFMARLQVVIVYLVAGLAKVGGHLWTSGTALYYTLNVDLFTHPLLREIVNSSPLVTVMMSYGVLTFQLSFPYLIWFQQTRRIWIAWGTVLHLGIAFGMGLTTFGFAMIASYFVFYTEAEAEHFARSFKNLSSSRRISQATSWLRLQKTGAFK